MADQPEKKPGRQPDYDLHALNKTTNAKAQVGAAWIKEDGSIGIVLNPFVTIPAGGQIMLTLFKVKRGVRPGPDPSPRDKPKTEEEPGSTELGPDEVPF